MMRKHRVSPYFRIYAHAAAVVVFVLLAAVLIIGDKTRRQERHDAVTQGATIQNSGAEEQEGSGTTAYTEVNGNVPRFSEADMQAEPFVRYSELDDLGRCGEAYALLTKDMMPRDKTRGPMTEFKPSGWHTVKYPEIIEDHFLYNRCHLIAFAFDGMPPDERNLITGTRYLNVTGMLPLEERVMRYLERTGNHVLYRVTPEFEGDELVARSVRMEAYSVEDKGEAICFHVRVHNIQPGITIDYSTGESRPAEE